MSTGKAWRAVLAVSIVTATVVATGGSAAADSDPTGDVYVALSDGGRFNGDGWLWHEFFGLDGEVPLTGDFNGDGKDDIVTFTQGWRKQVYVALSNGTGFHDARVWHGFFCLDGEEPEVGDFNGDGKDDIVTFTRGAPNDAIVALSNGGGFDGARVWHDFFGLAGEVPKVGDFNGDGKDDIVTFARGSGGDVYVALSGGDRFAASRLWHNYFAPGGEVPDVGDVNGDGRADIVTFYRGSAADVYVSLSDGSRFIEDNALWHDHFAAGSELPAVGDVTGDGRADIVTFFRGNPGYVYVAPSIGTAFVKAGAKWHDRFAPGDATPVVGDVDGDGKADVVAFFQG